MSNPDDEMSAIDPALLDAVMGGTASDEQISEALKAIQSSLDGLKKNNNNGPNWMQLLPFIMLASSGTLSFGGSTLNFGGGGGACGCGCGGMGLCRRRR